VRVVGVDLGGRRIGVAVSDPGRTLASPWGTIERGPDPDAAHEALAELAVQLGADVVVVGLPISMDGRRRRAARAAQAEADALGARLASSGVAVETFDERLTTVSAARALSGAGVRRQERRARIDPAAAAVMLQAWLDGRGRTRG